MSSDKESSCPCCGGTLKHYDRVKRTVRGVYGQKKRVDILWGKCEWCGRLYRQLPPEILPHKQYTADVIFAFVRGNSLRNDICYEDYPCERTVVLWRKRLSE